MPVQPNADMHPAIAAVLQKLLGGAQAGPPPPGSGPMQAVPGSAWDNLQPMGPAPSAPQGQPARVQAAPSRGAQPMPAPRPAVQPMQGAPFQTPKGDWTDPGTAPWLPKDTGGMARVRNANDYGAVPNGSYYIGPDNVVAVKRGM